MSPLAQAVIGHSPLQLICIEIQDLIEYNSHTLHKIQQRKGHELITGYSYEIKCDFGPQNNNNNESCTPSVPDPLFWCIVTTPKSSTVNHVLDNWKYQGEELQDDGLFLSLVDLTLVSFQDLERLTESTVEIGTKYIDHMNMSMYNKTMEGFQILLRNVEKMKVVLEELDKSTTDVVDSVGQDQDIKRKMDQLIEFTGNMFHTVPFSWKMTGKSDATQTISKGVVNEKSFDTEISKTNVRYIAISSPKSKLWRLKSKDHISDIWDVNSIKFFDFRGQKLKVDPKNAIASGYCDCTKQFDWWWLPRYAFENEGELSNNTAWGGRKDIVNDEMWIGIEFSEKESVYGFQLKFFGDLERIPHTLELQYEVDGDWITIYTANHDFERVSGMVVMVSLEFTDKEMKPKKN